MAFQLAMKCTFLIFAINANAKTDSSLLRVINTVSSLTVFRP